MCDITINNVNITDTEMTSILCTKNDGLVYFFSMATSFTKAALGAEGVGSDVTMIVGNGIPKDMLRLHCRNFVKARHYGRYLQSCMPEWSGFYNPDELKICFYG